jgi:peptide/nickel transport system substrate-binding protein
VMREDFCTYTQASVKEIGIDWKCEFKEWSVIVDDVNTGNFEALMPTWSGASVEPHELYRGFHTKGSNNVRGYSNPEVDALLEEGRVTVDLARRKEIYDKVQEIVHEELPVWYAWYRPYISVIDAKFDGPWFKTSYLYGGCFRNLFEWDVAQ